MNWKVLVEIFCVNYVNNFANVLFLPNLILVVFFNIDEMENLRRDFLVGKS